MTRYEDDFAIDFVICMDRTSSAVIPDLWAICRRRGGPIEED